MSRPCFPLLTHIQRASKFPSSSIMDQEMFYLLVLAHLSKRASNSLACPGTCPSDGMGGPQRRGWGRAELLKYWSVELSLSWFASAIHSPAGLGGGLKRPHNKEGKNSRVCLTPADFDWCCCFYRSSGPRRESRASPLYRRSAPLRENTRPCGWTKGGWLISRGQKAIQHHFVSLQRCHRECHVDIDRLSLPW